MVTRQIPQVYIQVADAAWPPAQGVYPVGYARVSDVTSERALASPIIPGKLAGGGFSVGTADATIIQPRDAHMTPWGRGSHQLTKGNLVHVFEADKPTGEITRDHGWWVLDNSPGSLASNAVTLELIETSTRGKTPNLLPADSISGQPRDLAWVVDKLARQCGYYATPAPAPSTVVDMPFVGDYGSVYDDTNGWMSTINTTTAVGGFWLRDLYVSFTAVGTVLVAMFDGSSPDASQMPAVEVRPGGVFAVRRNSDTAWSTGGYETGRNAHHPNKVELHLQVVDGEGVPPALRARARSDVAAPWSSWVTVMVPWDASWQLSRVSTFVSGGSKVGQLTASTTANLGVWRAPTAIIPPLGVSTRVAFLADDVKAWDGLQEVLQTFGAASALRTDRDVLEVFSWARMRGAAPTKEVIDLGSQAEDVAWRHSDPIDRLELTYQPAVVQGAPSTTGLEVWRAEEIYELRAGETKRIVASLPFAATDFKPFAPWWQPYDPPNTFEQFSRWSALPNRDGTGDTPDGFPLVVNVVPYSAGRVTITMRNVSSQTLYTVLPDGSPGLLLHAQNVAKPAGQVVLAAGVDEADATNTFRWDLGSWVDDPGDARLILDRLWPVLSSPGWILQSLELVPKAGRELGDIVEVRERRSGLKTKALLVSIREQVSASRYSQRVDVVRLPPSEYDLDVLWAGLTEADFDAAWAGRTDTDFDFDPLDHH